VRRASGAVLKTTVDQFGQHVVREDGTPVVVDDFVSDAQTQGSRIVTSSIYAVRVGMEGVVGLESGAGNQVVEVGGLETKDTNRWRIKSYTSARSWSRGAPPWVTLRPKKAPRNPHWSLFTSPAASRA